jgi:uncharacterized protein involved in outer membrane biogenesis
MIKWIFKWLLRLFILAVVLIVILILSLDSIFRVMVEHNIRKQTGMDAEIGSFHVGLLEPVITIKNLKLYNPPDFGGTTFLEIPEIHVEYDRNAIAQRELHLTLVRLNLSELDIVKNAAGQTNIFSLGLALPKKSESKNALKEFKSQTNLEFTGIDALNVSVGTLKYIDLKDQRNNHAQKVGVENFVIPHVKTAADLTGLGLLVSLRSGDFFTRLIDPKSPNADIFKLF